MEKNFKNYLLSKDYSNSTIKHYQMYAIEFLNWLDDDNTQAEQAGVKEVTAFLNYLQRKGQANKTRGIRLNVIKHFFDWQVQCGQRKDNPAKHLQIRGTSNKTLYPIFTPKELESLYNNYALPTEDDTRQSRNWWRKYELSRKRNKAALSLMVHQGITTAEADRLTPKDLKLREGIIYIAGSRKSNERELELKSHQVLELMEYSMQTRLQLLNLTNKQTDQLFVSRGENTLSNNNWKRSAIHGRPQVYQFNRKLFIEPSRRPTK
jgi:site-specific recombinase XerD